MKVDTSDLLRFVGFLDTLTESVHSNQERAVMAAGMAYQADVQRCSSTPVDTGQYRSSMRTDQIGNPLTGPIAAVGSPMPQTRRLEFGFWDKTDSRGRRYHQAPRPHWRPTWDLNLAKYHLILAEELLKGVKMK